MIKVRVIGAAGYGGIGIIELLSNHPETEIISLCDVGELIGKKVSDVYPHLKGFCDIVIGGFDEEIQKEADITFCATPDGIGMQLAEKILKSGSKLIDYSGDFRFNDIELYKTYAAKINREPIHKSEQLLNKSVYGFTELNRDKIKEADIVGNPGCLAISCILGLYPVFKSGWVKGDKAICDCKTGISGAGKKPAETFHFPNRYENMNAYKLTGHQHIMEIENELRNASSGKEVKITFTPQVIPLCRGIMSTLYTEIKDGIKEKDIIEYYKEFYKKSKFVKIAENLVPDNNLVRGTNLCYLKITFNEQTNTARIISHIDNLMKGQSGSAMQNMNVMFGLSEETGLMISPRLP